MIGPTLSHYEILEEISRGGMGIVYHAHDTRLRREVALKVLPEELVADADRKGRFVQEAQAAAAISHPNIAVVHEIDETEGLTFIVMELVEGQRLGELLKRGALPVSRALDLARQILAGLAGAHARGIVHRDLKPANILVLADDHVKVIDFGLAKLVEPEGLSPDSIQTAVKHETAAGTLLGTLAYMSPEQARGEPVDHRSDIFSFGVLLYEMLEGRPPFERKTPADTLGAILKDPTPPVTGGEVERIVERCLRKEPTERYDSVDQLISAIDTLRTKPDRPSRWLAAVGGSLLMAIVASGAWWLASREPIPLAVEREIVTVLVGDFENRTGEPIFDGAIEQALAIGLEGAPLIAVYDRARARQQSTELAPGGDGRLNEKMTRLLCQSQGIRLALIGSIESRGSSYSVRVSALDPMSGDKLAEAEETVQQKAGVLRAVDQLASGLSASLGHVPRSSPEQEESFTTVSLQAMHHYARARVLLRNGDTEEAISEYERAVAEDPEFGLAYAGLGAASFNLDRRDQAREYFEKALSLIHRMTDRERLETRGNYQVLLGNYPAAIDEYARLVERYPAASAGLSNLALAHFYMRHFEQALDTGQRAAAIYPKQSLQRANVAIYAIYAGSLDAAVREARVVTDADPGDDLGYLALALARLAEGQVEEAAAAYRKVGELGAREASRAAMGLADIALYEGRSSHAIRLLEPAALSDIEAGRNFLAANKFATLAEVRLESGEVARALDSASRALALSPTIGVPSRRLMVI
jgi:tetratricopeptide (TPR) repeat protein/predicted Ser/Thr protein kinase